MRFSTILVPAMLAAGAAAGFAQEDENAGKREGRRERPEVAADEPRKTPPKDGEAHRPKPREEGRPQNVRPQRGLGEAGPRSVMLRMFEDPEFCEKLGLSPADRVEIADQFRRIDQSVDAKRMELADLQANQAKLIVDGAAEEEIMEAVDKVWRARAEIAKMQTSKLLKLRSKLTEEQIRKIDQVRTEHFRTRRLEQLREGGPVRALREGREAPRTERAGAKATPPPAEGGRDAPPPAPEKD